MQQYKRVKLACYSANISMSIVGNLSPILFLTFRSLYGISYSLLGLLVLINFVTQLSIDLIFSFFSHKINMSKAVKITPILTLSGLLIYSLSPFIFASNVYLGLVIGTIVFSASGGFAEVLISPVIAAIPSENPEHEMSKLHSIYAWGVVAVIIISTLFLLAFDANYWWVLSLLFTLVPIFSASLFLGAKLPELEKPEKISGTLGFLKKGWLWMCVLAIFLGGAAECTMAQWSSSYSEQALGIPKVWGDIFGVALFALALGFGRTLYSKCGKNIGRVLCFGAIGSSACYLVAVVSNIPIIGLIACAMTGFCVSMMWPGSLIVAAERFPTAGVFIYAMMAAGGDLGASIAPQLVGIITDCVSKSDLAKELSHTLSLSCEQIGMKAGMLVGFIVSLIAIFVYLIIWKSKNNQSKKDC
ncbi:MAG: MFS transporter [Clostridia bacterium]|nr:MFS transporter [Clostridia bacterium]